MRVLHSDNHLLVVDKTAGLLSQGDSTGDPCALEIAREWVKSHYNKPGNVFLGLVHRLDRPVGGVMVLARTSKAASRLSDQFRKRLVTKIYRTVVRGVPSKPSGTLISTLDAKVCELDWTLDRTDSFEHLSELTVIPKTGRKHQIRRQLSGAGWPVVGDLRYGPRPPLENRAIALHAVELTVDHPTTKERMTFTSELPGWWPYPGVQRQ